MVQLVSVLVAMMMLGGAVAVIVTTILGRADAIVAALAGKWFVPVPSPLPARVVRISVRPAPRRPSGFVPLRAAA